MQKIYTYKYAKKLIAEGFLEELGMVKNRMSDNYYTFMACKDMRTNTIAHYYLKIFVKIEKS